MKKYFTPIQLGLRRHLSIRPIHLVFNVTGTIVEVATSQVKTIIYVQMYYYILTMLCFKEYQGRPAPLGLQPQQGLQSKSQHGAATMTSATVQVSRVWIRWGFSRIQPSRKKTHNF